MKPHIGLQQQYKKSTLKIFESAFFKGTPELEIQSIEYLKTHVLEIEMYSILVMSL